ncbi:MAG: hypothetical protein HN356_04335 [Calditrichaeota bacterium]|jgi:DUF438 domain-containing protein|nr:hypothetical protein [Calditrichota bacterium]MBT7617371.1 hypothetical protein [Calditrichota bacterium]MBT7790415.1 hypothetical protein [Calditrichota bacterium]
MPLNTETLVAILDTLNQEVVFVDNDHIIRFMNLEAKRHYHDRSGYSDLIGKSIFDCHNGVSNQLIKDVHARMVKGEDEIFPNEEKLTYSMVAVRDEKGELLGYFERDVNTKGEGL